MWNRYFEPGDLEDRRALKAVDTAQLIITGTLLISTLVIVQYFDTCNEKGRAWYYTLLYGNLFWIFYLFTSLIGKYKNDMVKRFFAVSIPPFEFLSF